MPQAVWIASGAGAPALRVNPAALFGNFFDLVFAVKEVTILLEAIKVLLLGKYFLVTLFKL